MYLEFTPVSAEVAQRIRVVSRAVGHPSIVVAVIAGILIVSFGLLLSFKFDPIMIFTVIMGLLSSLFALFSGITLVKGPHYVKTGDLNVTYARQSRRLLLIFWIATIVPTGIAVLFSVPRGTDEFFTPAFLGYFALLWVPFVTALIDMLVGIPLLKPPDQLVQQYGGAQR